MKTDKSSKVGGRRKAGPAAPKKSMARMIRGRPCLLDGARKTYTSDGKPSNGRPAPHKPTRRIR